MHLVIALALFVAQEKKQDPSAEELLKKVEEKGVKAKTFRQKAKIVLDFGEDKGGELDTESVFKGDKFRVTLAGQAGPQKLDIKVVCDGAKIHVNPPQGEPKTKDAPKGAGEGMRLVLLRGGSFLPAFVASEREGDPRELLTVKDLKYGKDEKVGERACKVLVYTLTMKDERDEPEITLWVDAETHLPVKRQLKGGKGETITETYSDTKLDEDLKDADFDLPK
jgi:outer membrane lipoprotein-sorting protein